VTLSLKAVPFHTGVLSLISHHADKCSSVITSVFLGRWVLEVIGADASDASVASTNALTGESWAPHVTWVLFPGPTTDRHTFSGITGCHPPLAAHAIHPTSGHHCKSAHVTSSVRFSKPMPLEMTTVNNSGASPVLHG
jgi:hypothetical protein